MEFRTLGRTGIQVSELCFGTMSFGREADERMSARMFRRCREAGINFFDTANAYSAGRSEEILGRLIQGSREELVLTSKFCLPMGEDVNAKGASRRHGMRAIEGSLKRLSTEWIDIYFVHNFDPLTPIETTLRALGDLVHQGKILHPAVSNWAAWQIAKGLGISALEGLATFACIQPMYNLVKRQAEVEILPLAEAEGLGVISYSPLGAGLLTGKYGVERWPKEGRLVENDMYMKRYGPDIYYQIADRFADHAHKEGVNPVSLAVAWVKSHPAITAPIIGARDVDQLEGSLGALDIDMTPEWRDEISSLSIAPPLATDRLEMQSVS